MTLRVVIMVLGIAALVAQFFLSLHEDTSKQRDNEVLQAKLKGIEDGINVLVSQGKLASADARNLLVIAENLQFHEKLQIEVIPERGEK